MAVENQSAEAIQGYRLTTAEILYHLPDHPAVLQSYIWQELDIAPRLPGAAQVPRFLDPRDRGQAAFGAGRARSALIQPAALDAYRAPDASALSEAGAALRRAAICAATLFPPGRRPIWSRMPFDDRANSRPARAGPEPLRRNRRAVALWLFARLRHDPGDDRARRRDPADRVGPVDHGMGAVPRRAAAAHRRPNGSGCIALYRQIPQYALLNEASASPASSRSSGWNTCTGCGAG